MNNIAEIVSKLEAAGVTINEINYEADGTLRIDADPMDVMERVFNEMGWME